MLKLVIGKAKSGKTEYIYDHIKKADDKNEKSFLIVPEQFTMEAESELSKRLESGVLLNIEVISFERLAFRLVDNMRGINAVKIDDHGKIMVLRRLFNHYKDEMQIFKRATNKEGFLSEFNNLIQELKRNRITSEELSAVIKNLEPSLLVRKLTDVSVIYNAFDNYMKDKYLDSEDRFEALIEAMDNTLMFEESNIWIDNFNGFTVQEKAVLEKMIVKAKNTTVALTIDTSSENNQSVFLSTMKSFKYLQQVAKDSEIDVSFREMNWEIDNIELRFLESQLFNFPCDVYSEKPESINLFAGQDLESEIEHIAMEIVRLVRDEGYRWKDISVIKGSENYTPIIKRCFMEYDIPFFNDEKRGIIHNPVIQFILSALMCIDRYYKQEDVIRFIKVGFLDIEMDEIEKFENFVLAFGIKGKGFVKNIKEELPNSIEMEELRVRVMSKLLELSKSCKKTNSVENFVKSLYSFLISIGVPEKIKQWIEYRKNYGENEWVLEMTQIWNILMNTMDQLIELMADQEMSLREFIKLLEAGFSEYRIGIIPTSADNVLIGSVNRSKSHGMKVIFIVGTNDGQIPSYTEGDGILLNDEKILLAENQLILPSTSDLKQQEEDLSVYSVFNKSSEKVYISYALANEKGSALRPSILIEKLKEIFPKIEVETDIREKAQELKIVTPIPTFKYLVKNLRDYVDGKDIDPIWWNAYKWYSDSSEWKDSVERVIEGLFHNNQPRSLNKKEIKAVYDLPLIVSTSRLEKFADCPFAHFVRYGLKPKTRKVYKVEYPDIGLLFHKSVEYFAHYLNEHGLSWQDLDRNEMYLIIDNIIEQLADEHEHKILKSSFRYKYLMNKIRRISNRAVNTLGHQLEKGSFKLEAHEIAFGNAIVQGGIPPLVIDMKNGERLIIEGRVDRIDILEQGEKKYVKVIDYKSGYRKFNLSDVFFGIQIQLVLYMDAIIKNGNHLVKDRLHPGGMFYFRIDDPLIETEEEIKPDVIEKAILKELRMDGLTIKNIDVVKALDNTLEASVKSDVIPVALKKDESFSSTSSVVEEDEMEMLIEYVEQMAGETGERIMDGSIEIAPCKTKDYVACQRCDYQAICQFDQKIKNNQYRIIQKLSKDKIIEKLHDWSEENAKLDPGTSKSN